MKSLKTYFILYFICLLITDMISQPSINDGKAHRRYWYYRTRLINDFTKIGIDQGDCIMFPERNQDAWPGNQTAKVGPDQIDEINQYLAALALEYQLLSRNNQSTSETVKEIFHFLYAINRLDEEADQFWSGASSTPSQDLISPIASDRNGFILREDMPMSYLYNAKNQAHFNYALQETSFDYNNPAYNNNTTNPNYGSFQNTISNYGSYTGLPHLERLDYDNKFSNLDLFDPNSTPNSTMYGKSKRDLPLVQEKYHSMLVAFMFLIKYIPPGEQYKVNGVAQQFQDGETYIVNEVQNITMRILNYINGTQFGNILPTWVLEYPNGVDLDEGAFATTYAWPLAHMICKIMSGYTPSGGWQTSCGNYLDITAQAAEIVYWGLSTTPANSEDGAVMTAYCQAGSNLPNNIIPIWLDMQINSSIHHTEWADLMRKVLHQTGLMIPSEASFANPIDDAPCLGPYNFGNCSIAPCEWSSQSRSEHPVNRGAGCVASCGSYGGSHSSCGFRGYYTGVDYMLLHNLYYEHLNQLDDAGNSQSSDYKNAYNLMDNYDAMTWPVNIGFGLTLGTTPHPANVKVFQNLQSRAQIYATASPLAPSNTLGSEIEYRAGKEIALLAEDLNSNAPGFFVESGSEFSAYIQRYICTSSSDYGNGMRPAKDVSLNDYETDEMNTETPIHYEKGQPVQYVHFADPTPSESYTSRPADKNRKFEIFPNPNNGAFKIEVTKIYDNEILSLGVIDSRGVVIYENTDFNASELDLKTYPKGLYIVNVKSSLGFIYTKKISITE
jgi:hypothetical protein